MEELIELRIEIARLDAENERMREALKPFSDAASTDDYIDDIEIAETDTARKITFGDLRRACDAIKGTVEPNRSVNERRSLFS